MRRPVCFHSVASEDGNTRVSLWVLLLQRLLQLAAGVAVAAAAVQEALATQQAKHAEQQTLMQTQIGLLQQQLLDAEAVRRSELERAFAEGGLAASKPTGHPSTTASCSGTAHYSMATPEPSERSQTQSQPLVALQQAVALVVTSMVFFVISWGFLKMC